MTLTEILEEKVPTEAVNYCVQLWEETPFHFKVSKTRSTCLGNYRYFKKQHYISVNHDLNRYNFLITYVHEVAHLRIQLNNRKLKKTLPHGVEWKQMFSSLMQPTLKLSIFPWDVLEPLNIHMQNPKASSTRDPNLLSALKKYNPTASFTLSEVADGAVFQFKNNIYTKLHKRRTRALVQDFYTKKRYTLSLLAEVKMLPIDNK